MGRDQVFEKIVNICRDVFDDEDLSLTDTSSAADVEAWDSLTHLSIVSDIEDEFNVKLSLDEVNSKTLGDLVNAVVKHLG